MSVFLSKLQDDFLLLTEEVRDWVTSCEKTEIKSYQDIQDGLDEILDKKALVHLVVVMSTYVNGVFVTKPDESKIEPISNVVASKDVEMAVQRVRLIKKEPFMKAALMLDRVVRLDHQMR